MEGKFVLFLDNYLQNERPFEKYELFPQVFSKEALQTGETTPHSLN